MYSKIEILNTEYPEKYLLISNNNTLYIGVIIKDIVNFLKNEISIDLITHEINTKYKIQLTNKDINETKISIDKFLLKKDSSSLYKVTTLINPSKISIPNKILNLFSTRFFYTLFLISLIINVFFAIKIPINNQTNSFFENIIIFTSIFFILFIHEFGHSISAKKFNVIIREIGFGFYYFFPVLYVNLNETWKLNKRKRTIINLAGIYFQLIIGLIILILINLTDENKLLSVIFKMNITIVILNLNPFLKFDGYWVLSDFFEDNNLLKTSNSLLTKKNNLKKTNKFRYAIILYTILRLIFIFYAVILIFKKITLIINKSIENIKLENNETIFIFILAIYFLRIIFIKSKKYLTLQKKSSFFEYKK